MNAVIMAKEYSYCAFDLRELMILEFGRVRIYEIDMHLRKFDVPIVKHDPDDEHLKRRGQHVTE